MLLISLMYISQCLPKKWIYYYQPMDEMHFFYYCLLQDQERGATESLSGRVRNSGGTRKESLFTEIKIDKDTMDYVNNLIGEMSKGDIHRRDNLATINFDITYSEFEKKLDQLDNMLGGDSYYSTNNRSFWYEIYMGDTMGYVKITNVDEIVDNMYASLKSDLEYGYYHTYSLNLFINEKIFTKEEKDNILVIFNYISELFKSDMDIELKYVNMLKYYDEIDTLLGGNTKYGANFRDKNFYKTYSLEDGLKSYKSIIENEYLTNTYARYYSDYMTILAGILPAVFGAFFLWKDKKDKSQDLISSKQMSSFKYVTAKYIGICILFLCLYLIFAIISTICFTAFSINYKIDIDYFAFIKYTIGWIMPTVCITTATSIFLYLLFMNPIPSIAIELLIFFFSSIDLYGNYYIYKPIIRFNEIGRYDFYKQNLENIIVNRFSMIVSSFILVVISSVIYESRRRGKKLLIIRLGIKRK